ncbi:MAG: ACT domain-containing protein, partial [Candidatus Diapherotrites archaeon]
AKKPEKKPETKTTDSFKKIALAQCCNPLPGEKIVGYKTTKRKITIHSADCRSLAMLPKNKKIQMEWGSGEKKAHSVKLKVRAVERAGILIDLLTELEKKEAKIASTETKSEKGGTIKFEFNIMLKDTREFQGLKEAILAVPAVIEVSR